MAGSESALYGTGVYIMLNDAAIDATVSICR